MRSSANSKCPHAWIDMRYKKMGRKVGATQREHTPSILQTFFLLFTFLFLIQALLNSKQTGALATVYPDRCEDTFRNAMDAANSTVSIYVNQQTTGQLRCNRRSHKCCRFYAQTKRIERAWPKNHKACSDRVQL